MMLLMQNFCFCTFCQYIPLKAYLHINEYSLSYFLCGCYTKVGYGFYSRIIIILVIVYLFTLNLKRFIHHFKHSDLSGSKNIWLIGSIESLNGLQTRRIKKRKIDKEKICQKLETNKRLIMFCKLSFSNYIYFTYLSCYCCCLG